MLQFNSWSVLNQENKKWLCQCACGNESNILPFDLKSGKSKMCRPCSIKARKGQSNAACITHGMSDTPTQQVWTDMKRRCLNPNRRGYENYGGRGIKISDRWISGFKGKSGFHCFVEDIGVRPSPCHQLDRKDNDGDYEPSNCHWILKKDQNYNKRNTFKVFVYGEEMNLEQAELKFGIKKSTIFQRIHTQKMHPEKAVSLPIRLKKPRDAKK